MLERIDRHREALLAALEEIESLADVSRPADALSAWLGSVAHRLLAHELASERLVTGRLRRAHAVDTRQLDAFAAEVDALVREADRLSRAAPDSSAARGFARAVREHLERRVRVLAPAARSALAAGLLDGTPAWYIEDVYQLFGEPAAHTPEEWLG